MSANPKHPRATSRPSTPSRSSTRYLVSPRSRSGSSLPPPKVLPFPDIPVRPLSVQSSRANSRAPSPPSTSSPHTHPSSSQHVRLSTEHATNMSITASSDSADGRGILNVPSQQPPNNPSPRLTFATPTPEPGPSRINAASPSTSSTTRPIPVPNVNLGSPSRAGFSSLSLSPPSIALPGSNSTTNVPAVAFDQPEQKEIPPLPVKRNSGRSSSRPPALQITPSAPHTPLADHMHNSFLKGTCADVRLVVHKWGVAYNVHKMVLTQAAFFHSLFLGGFSETSGLSKGKRRASDDDWNGEVVELTFDDPNIVRAAFEICLSRLYSPHPHLQFPTHLLPTPQHPLTQSFPPTDGPSLESIQSSLPVNTHLATPRLLLSILATSIYLGHGSLMHEAITIVLRTVGPCTVNRYLGFAQGDGIGEEEWEGQSQSGAKDLDAVAHLVKRDSVDSTGPYINLPVPGWNPSSTSLSDDESKVGGSSSRPAGRALGPVVAGGDDASSEMHDLPHFYGFTGNKIGEACACWLSRWGVELLDIETSLSFPSPVPIWSHRGLPSTLVRAVLSSDSFFVKTEMERYKVARRVLDLRRKGWELEMEGGDISMSEAETDGGHWDDWSHDEEELAHVFSDGIYYTHMTFEDLTTIASDIDPHTSAPFVPLSVLQAAHWAAADLRNRIISPALPDELSLITTATSLAAPDSKTRKITPRSVSARNSISNLAAATNDLGRVELFHPVPSDDTYRIGAGGLMLAVVPGALPGIPDLPDLGPEPEIDESTRPSRRRSLPQGEKTAFGLTRGCRTRAELLEEHSMSLSGLSLTDTTSTKWIKPEPFRFSVEFWGLDRLAEKERAYSETHFYAGSWFNVYVQTMRKKDKGTQLGIYLHRQNPAEVFPKPCVPRGTARSSEPTSALGLSNAAAGGLYRAISTTPVALGSPITATQRTSESKEEPAAPYKDPRRVTRAYFSISCASALGTALIRFSSAPDNFTNSQSWGWKSSALRSEEYLSTLGEESLEEGVLGWLGEGDVKEGSLRASVVVGVV